MEAIGEILARGHSRVPVYSGNPQNIIGLLLVSFWNFHDKPVMRREAEDDQTW
jgi:CBS domain containing-hemolysin-like protein